MEADLETLGREVVKRGWWRWMRGMTSIWGHDETDDGRPMRWLVRGPERIGPFADGSPEHNADVFPDLSDPATLGCLHALAEELAGGRVSVIASFGGEWRAETADRCRYGPTRAHALFNLCDALAGVDRG